MRSGEEIKMEEIKKRTAGDETELKKWYQDVTLPEAESYILSNMKSAARSVIAIGYYLKCIRDGKMYLEAGYETIWEYAESKYGFSKSTASRYMSRNDKFSVEGNSPILAEEYREYSKAQLQEMLTLNDDQLEQIRPDMTVKQIREIRKPLVKDIPYFEIPGQMSFSASDFLDVPEVREEVEKTEPRPGRDTYTVNLRDFFPGTKSVAEAAEKLPVVATSQREPETECRLPESASSVWKEEENMVPVFTSELSAEHAYGWTWQEAVKAYLSKVHEKGWKEGQMPEIMFHSLGREYHATIEGTRVAFSMDGKIQFLVEDERLRKEYDFFHSDGNAAEEQQNTQNAAETQQNNEDAVKTQQDEPPVVVSEGPGSADEGTQEEIYTPQYFLEREKKKLEKMLKAFKDTEPEKIPKKLVAHQKIIVAALAGMVCDLEEIELQRQMEKKRQQPELPEFKNNDQWKEWLRGYRNWGLWYEDRNIGAKYYKYDFDNGARLIAEEYVDGPRGFISSFLHLVGGPKPPKHPKYGHGKWSWNENYNKYPNSETELVEFLKETQRK